MLPSDSHQNYKPDLTGYFFQLIVKYDVVFKMHILNERRPKCLTEKKSKHTGLHF